LPYLVGFDPQITPLPLSLSKSRWANWLAARATRQGRVRLLEQRDPVGGNSGAMKAEEKQNLK